MAPDAQVPDGIEDSNESNSDKRKTGRIDLDRKIQRVVVEGLYGRTTLAVDFNPGLNIIFGPNGSGKSTLLHILANLLHGDSRRFFHLSFKKITVQTFDGAMVTIDKSRETSALKFSVNGDLIGVLPAGTIDSSASNTVDAKLLEIFPNRPAYLPAFRSVLEASSGRSAAGVFSTFEPPDQKEAKGIAARFADRLTSVAHEQRDLSQERRRRELVESLATKTVQCRQWFGQFVPLITYPSLRDVTDDINKELRDAHDRLASHDREAFSKLFVNLVAAVTSEGPDTDAHSSEAVLASIRKRFDGFEPDEAPLPAVYSDLQETLLHSSGGKPRNELLLIRVLNLFDLALEERQQFQKQVFFRLRTFRNSVNAFLDGKEIILSRFGSSRHPGLRVRHGTTSTKSLTTLSSGERHVVTLLFSATHMSESDGVVLIDEPELSFHVDWQRIILRELQLQCGDRQIIACSHAPEVMADHRRAMISIRQLPWSAEPQLFDSQSGDTGEIR